MRIKPGAAFLLMIVLCVAAVGVGAWRGWQDEKGMMLESRRGLEDRLQLRVECAYNLLTVASRHMEEEEAAFQAVLSSRKVLEDAAASFSQKATASEHLTRDGQALLETLSQLPSVQADARDLMYVQEYLPQMLHSSTEKAEAEKYRQAAHDYNGRLNGTISGRIAGLLGFGEAEAYDLP